MVRFGRATQVNSPQIDNNNPIPMKTFTQKSLALVAICWAIPFAAAPLSAQDTADDFEARQTAAINAAVERVAPCVVRIETFGGLERVGGVLVGSGPTTGLLVHEEGYVLSSAFNFARKPASILVSLAGGDRAPAEIVARDHSRMLVLVKIKADKKKFPTPEVAAREQWRVGQWTIAVGRTFAPDDVNISTGILSATNRIWGRAVQTDCKISPANYGGPLIDLEGCVIGILTPMSPNAQGEVAGAEWYDSGIGFAAPLVDVMPQLPKLQRGEDVHRGLLGVSLARGNVYADPAAIAAAPANSPAAKAGLKKGDTIIEIDGRDISRQSELRHALGGRYAGETVKIVAVRGADRIEATATLAAELQPYEHPFLGILPARKAAEEGKPGVVVRWVYENGPAAAAGLSSGDRIVKFAGDEVASAAGLRDSVAALAPGETVELSFIRDGKEQSAKIELGTLPEEIPSDLPPPNVKTVADPEGTPATGVIEVKLAEESNECHAFVPEDYHPQRVHGALVWLHAAGSYDKDAMIEQWKAVCDERDLILIVPKAAKDHRWNRTEVEFIQKVIDEIARVYDIDANRVVVGGYQAGGAMAYLVGFSHRDLVRGIISVDAPLPPHTQPPPNDPVERLAILATVGDGEKESATKAGVKKLRDARFPVTTLDKGEKPQALTDEDRATVGRWMDALDRI